MITVTSLLVQTKRSFLTCDPATLYLIAKALYYIESVKNVQKQHKI